MLASIVLAALPSVAVATHNQDLEHAHFINQPGTTLGGSFNTSDSNLGDASYNPGEPTRCTAGENTNFGSSVFV